MRANSWSGLKNWGITYYETTFSGQSQIYRRNPIEYGYIRLIEAADKRRSSLDDEEIIVDADNLSKLCIEHVIEKYKPDSYTKVIEIWEKEFSGRIKTLKAKTTYPRLLEKLKDDLVYEH